MLGDLPDRRPPLLRYGILVGMYRDRLALEWRAAAAVAATAMLVAVAERLPLPVDGLWLLVGLGIVLLVAVGVVLSEIWRRPLPAAAPPTRFRAHEIAAATQEGQPRARGRPA